MSINSERRNESRDSQDRRKKRRPHVIVLTPLIVLFAVSLTWIFLLKPILLDWAKENAPRFIQEKTGMTLKFDELELSLAKLNLTAFGLTVANHELPTEGNPLAKIGSIKVQVNFFALLVGRVSVSSIVVNQGHVQISGKFLNSKSGAPSSPKKKNWNDGLDFKDIAVKPLFKILPEVPVETILLKDLKLSIHDLSSLKVEDFGLSATDSLEIFLNSATINNDRNEISIENFQLTSDLEVFLKSKSEPSTHVSTVTWKQVRLSETELQADDFKFQYRNTFVTLNARATELNRLLFDPSLSFIVDSRIDLTELHSLAQSWLPEYLKSAKVSGSVKVAGDSKFESLAENSGRLDMELTDVGLNEFALGTAGLKAVLKNNTVKIDEIKIDHPSGKATLNQIYFEQQPPYKLKAQIKAHQFDLQKLFVSIGLKDIPVLLEASAQSFCEGEIQPFRINCQAQMETRNFDVKTDLNDSFSIVRISRGTVTGDVTFNPNGLTYKAIARLKDSPFQSSGEVKFKEGFKLNFESEGLDLESAEDIADLGLKGKLKGKLTTFGDTSQGRIESDLEATDFEISKFKIGTLKSKFNYEKGSLKFLNATIQKQQTQASGEVIIDVSNSKIQGQITAAQATLEDVMQILPENLRPPFTVAGPGSLKIEFSGPLDFWKLNYTLSADFRALAVLGESFNSAQVQLASDGEELRFNQVSLNKPTGKIFLGGRIVTRGREPELELNISTLGLRLEEMDQLRSFFMNTSADLSALGKWTGPISNTDLKVSFTARDTLFEGVASPNTQGEFHLTPEKMEVRASLLGRQAQIQIERIFKNEDLVFEAQVRDFNPLSLTPLLSLPQPPADTLSRVSGSASLIFRNGAPIGSIQVEDFLIQRSSQSLKLVQPAKIEFNSDLTRMQPIRLTGPDQSIAITLDRESNRKALNIAGRVALRPFQFLIPFAENLSGFSEFQFRMDLNQQKVSLSGEGLIDQASMTMKGFPYPLTKTSAYFDFTQSKILISELNSEMNQSPITASGFIDFKGPKQIVVNLSAQVPNMSLEFPPKYQTQGQAQIDVLGQWPPYTLKVNYVINDGLITDDFTNEATRGTQVSPNRFLPTQSLEENVPSLLLDIDANFRSGIVVKNRILEGIASGQISVKGSVDRPEMMGTVNIEPGSKLFFKDTPFEVKNGVVQFMGGPEINPQVLITADARVSDYDINLLVKGTGTQLVIEPSSQPALSRNDIFTLLALGYTATKLDQGISSELQEQQTGLEILANISNQSEINKTIQEKLGLNVQLAPSIDSTRNIAVPKVVVSKQLGKKVNTSYSRPLTGDRQNNEIRLQWLFQPNWSLIMNYQNQSNDQDNGVLAPTETESGVGGLDLEFKKEFK